MDMVNNLKSRIKVIRDAKNPYKQDAANEIERILSELVGGQFKAYLIECQHAGVVTHHNEVTLCFDTALAWYSQRRDTLKTKAESNPERYYFFEYSGDHHCELIGIADDDVRQSVQLKSISLK